MFDLAQYGIAFLIVGGLIYLGQSFISKWYEKKPGLTNGLSTIVQNNTNAMEKMVVLLQTIQVSQAKQEVKIDQLLRKH